MPTSFSRLIYTLSASIVCVFGILPTSSAQQPGGSVANGIVVFREQPGQTDEFANGMLFKRMTRFAAVSNFDAGRLYPVVLENAKIAAVAMFDDLYSRNLIGASDQLFLESKDTEITAIMVRFPKTVPLLKPVLDAVKSDLENMKDGQVRFRSGWATRTAFETMIKQEEQREKDQQMAIKKAADDRKANEKRKLMEIASKAEEEDRKKRSAVEVAERQKRQEAEDVERRQLNLKTQPQSLGARSLLKGYDEFLRLQESSDSSSSFGNRFSTSIPSEWKKQAVLLPKTKELEPALHDGASFSSPALLYLTKSDKIKSVRIAVPMRIEEKDLINKTDMKDFLDLAASAMPDLAEWLPFGLASARTKLAFQKSKRTLKGEASISRDLDGHKCELLLSDPAIHDDGNFYSYLTLTIH